MSSVQFIQAAFFRVACFLLIPSSLALALEFGASVPAKQRQAIEADLKALSFLPLKDRGSGLREFYLIPENARLSSSLLDWLNQRALYIVGNAFALNETSLRTIGKEDRYPEPTLFPSFVADFAERLTILPRGPGGSANASAGLGNTLQNTHLPSGDSSNVVVSNLGGLLYGIAKVKRQRLEVRIEDLGWKRIVSSQNGIFRIGERLFSGPQVAAMSSVGQQLRRLQYYFHEARHGDGHGRTMLFPHVECPAGHDYEGQFACDQTSNGSYSAGATILRALAQSCERCSARDKEALRLQIADQFGRVLNSYRWDPTPEGIAP